ncbi:MAG TPA: hypothetical protein VNO55_18820 [Polyangia bacterium]|nr:hypothetical protein [Polyangia bacterium]
MPVPCKALNSFHLVAGCDLHKQIPPPPPVGPNPFAPHVVVYCLGFAMPSTSLKSATVKAGMGHALGRQHDLGMGIYHFAANILLPLVWAGAGNKAEFGVASVTIGATPQGPKRMAVALVPFVGLNLQLDCSEPLPLNTSLVVASFNDVSAGFTLRDCIAGFVAMRVDQLYVFLVGAVIGKAANGFVALLGKTVIGNMAMLAGGVVAAAFPKTAAYLGAVATQLVGWIVGTPLGYSKESKLSSLGGKLNDSITEWISPTPTPPAPSPSTPPSR